MSPIQSILQHGQQVWLDNLSRELIRSGSLARWIQEDGIAGVTSNPSIFFHAIRQDATYQSHLASLRTQISDRERRFEALVLPDIIDACHLLLPLYQATQGKMGYVSFEVSPYLAHDADETLSATRRLWSAINQPNAMIKIPATPAGIKAFEEATAEGINVNLTLLFSLSQTEQAFDAYIRGLQRRLDANLPIDTLYSVASVFISRVDTAIDALLPDSLASLKGNIAIASAKSIYREWQHVFDFPAPFAPFAKLKAAGAQPQRLLWASTGNKNPQYRDVRYIEELIGSDTINTAPEATLMAFLDHGLVQSRLDQDIPEALDYLLQLQEAGIHLETIAQTLQKEGLKQFEDAFKQLLELV
jgi:transaldolase